MSYRREPVRSVFPLVALFLLAVGISACGGGSASSTSPAPAASVTALPGLTQADKKQDRAAYRAVQMRAINVYIADGTSPAERRKMGERIAAMPEVVAYHYVTEREALDRAAHMSKRWERVVETLTINPLPASFDILVRDVADVPVVAARFYDDPLVDNDPGTHTGVYARGGSSLLKASPSP